MANHLSNDFLKTRPGSIEWKDNAIPAAIKPHSTIWEINLWRLNIFFMFLASGATPCRMVRGGARARSIFRRVRFRQMTHLIKRRAKLYDIWTTIIQIEKNYLSEKSTPCLLSYSCASARVIV